MNRTFELYNNRKSKYVEIASSVIAIIGMIAHMVLVGGIVFSLCAGIATYDISIYILGSMSRSLVIKKNWFSFKMRCGVVAIASASFIYSILMKIKFDDYLMCWVLLDSVIVAFTILVAYNGYQAERSANAPEED